LEKAFDNNLPYWEKAQTIITNGKTKETLSFIDIKKIDGTLTRVNARYRLAKSFNTISLEDYSENSIEGYSSLMRVFLVYSTFESYLKLITNESKKCKAGKALLNTKEAKQVSKKILKLDKNKKFYKFISSFSQGYVVNEIEKFYTKEDHNLVCLLSSIRHIFVHGSLTPHANGMNPKTVQKICNLLSDFFLDQIAKDFFKRIK